MNVLNVDKISKRFKDKNVLKEISCELSPGIYGLVGADGAGKTTLKVQKVLGTLQLLYHMATLKGLDKKEAKKQMMNL